jgi:hypothetical protein
LPKFDPLVLHASHPSAWGNCRLAVESAEVLPQIFYFLPRSPTQEKADPLPELDLANMKQHKSGGKK